VTGDADVRHAVPHDGDELVVDPVDEVAAQGGGPGQARHQDDERDAEQQQGHQLRPERQAGEAPACGCAHAVGALGWRRT
jgi:hypothetical protein